MSVDHTKSGGGEEHVQKLHYSKDSSSSSACLDSVKTIRSSNDHGMRVGSNYQADIPQFIAYAPAPEYYEEEKAIRVWSPYNKISDHVLEEFISKAKEKFCYNMEQALGMLSWHKFDIARAYADLPNFVPYPNEWSVEDKVLFEQAYQFHEKQFQKIKQMLPDKSMANLISYYYSWKKTRTRASLMERQTRRFASRKNAGADAEDEGDDENENIANDLSLVSEENGADDDGDSEEMDTELGNRLQNRTQEDDEREDDPDIWCCMCRKELRISGKNLGVIIDPVVDKFCTSCYLEWKSGGKLVMTGTEIGDCFYGPDGSARKILFCYQDVVRLVEGNQDQGELMLKQLEGQIEDSKREIQNKKQKLSFVNDKIKPIAEQITELDMNEFSDILPDYKPTKSWTSDETALVLQALRRYGTDFSAIADVLRTKSPEAIKMFYVSQKDRLNLELLVQDHERTKAVSKIDNSTTQQQTTTTTSTSTTNTPPTTTGTTTNQQQSQALNLLL